MEQIFTDQVTTNTLLQSLFYVLSCLCIVLGIVGLGFIDMAFVRTKNVLDTWAQKIGGIFFAAFGFAVIGYPLWFSQYNVAFGVKQPILQAFKDWWLGGGLINTISGHIDPKLLLGADVMQLFFVFWLIYAMITVALLHGGLLERLKPAGWFILSFMMGAIIQPLCAYFNWGSLASVTNGGFHDYVGVASSYLLVGVFSLMINLFVGPRLGSFEDHSSLSKPVPHNFALMAIGVLLLFGAIPPILVGCGYIEPGVGYFGINLNYSGIGIVLANVVMGFMGGALIGCAMAYKSKQAIWLLAGPIAGYITIASFADIGKPWQVFLISLAGPPLCWLGYKIMMRLRIDDAKLAPLTILPGTFGLILSGFINRGVKQGGFFGLEGKYAPQAHAITPGMQIIGWAICIGFAVVGGLILGFLLKKARLLRITEETEIRGMDLSYWNQTNFGEEERVTVLKPELSGGRTTQ